MARARPYERNAFASADCPTPTNCTKAGVGEVIRLAGIRRFASESEVRGILLPRISKRKCPPPSIQTRSQVLEVRVIVQSKTRAALWTRSRDGTTQQLSAQWMGKQEGYAQKARGSMLVQPCRQHRPNSVHGEGASGSYYCPPLGPNLLPPQDPHSQDRPGPTLGSDNRFGPTVGPEPLPHQGSCAETQIPRW